MSRMEEYQNLLEDLENGLPSELEGTLERARKKRKRAVVRPLSCGAACFVIFVLLVNFCAPVAYACSRVPGLRELAEAVTFSRSLADAVDHEYVQPINLSQTVDGVTATVEYLIVDQKQVNVFYSLDSEVYSCMSATPDVRNADGTHVQSSIMSGDYGVENGELRRITVDFVEQDVPESLILQLRIQDNGAPVKEAPVEANVNDYLMEDQEEESEFVAELEFLLEFDPAFTAAGKVYPIDQTVVLDGQEITITQMEVYPTHLRVNVEESSENTAWLKALEFYIETDWGMTFDTISNGITATGSTETQSMVSYRADSTYFYEAGHLKIVITGAEWLYKDRETIHIDLKEEKAKWLPEGTKLETVTREGDGWILELRIDCREDGIMQNLISSKFYDAEGTEYQINTWSHISGDFDEEKKMLNSIERVPLRNYPYEEVWIGINYSHVWETDEEIVVPVW